MFNTIVNFQFMGQRIPQRMVGGIRRYLEHGVKPGAFLYAVFCNDLKEAAGAADDENIRLLHVYAAFMYSVMPRASQGSKELVDAWIAKKGGI